MLEDAVERLDEVDVVRFEDGRVHVLGTIDLGPFSNKYVHVVQDSKTYKIISDDSFVDGPWEILSHPLRQRIRIKDYTRKVREFEMGNSADIYFLH